MSTDEETQLVYNLSRDVKQLKKIMNKEDVVDQIDEDDIVMVLENLKDVFNILITKAKNEKIIK